MKWEEHCTDSVFHYDFHKAYSSVAINFLKILNAIEKIKRKKKNSLSIVHWFQDGHKHSFWSLNLPVSALCLVQICQKDCKFQKFWHMLCGSNEILKQERSTQWWVWLNPPHLLSRKAIQEWVSRWNMPP